MAGVDERINSVDRGRDLRGGPFVSVVDFHAGVRLQHAAGFAPGFGIVVLTHVTRREMKNRSAILVYPHAAVFTSRVTLC